MADSREADGVAGVYEFFAGGGMARLGLGPRWRTLFANDFDPRKAESYRANFGGAPELKVADIRSLTAADLPGRADLAWGSFPCQDLSLAGLGAGLRGERSGSVYPFWRLMDELARDGRAPSVVVLENVCGTLTAGGGAAFEAVCGSFAAHGYRSGALVVDAALFTPQSRPRLFLVGVREGRPVPPGVLAARPSAPFHPPALVRAVERLPPDLRERQLWWSLALPPPRRLTLEDVVEDAPGVAWNGEAASARLLQLMSPLNRARVEAAMREGRRRVGALYRRTRRDGEGGREQRAEVRFDGLSGCLRTPAGGSSRQQLLVVEGASVRSRLLSPREAARLMGLPDGYRLPERATDAYHLLGDGVAVDVVRHLARHLLEPLAGLSAPTRAAA